jgi:hypothetical protein
VSKRIGGSSGRELEYAVTLHYEIVRVIDAAKLFDSESYERCYRTRGGRALLPGHYVVLWEEAVEWPAFDEKATYVGPYQTALLADIMLHDFLLATPVAGAASAAARSDQATASI